MKQKKDTKAVNRTVKTLPAEPLSYFQFKRDALTLGIILLIGFLIYSNTWKVPFHLDDRKQIVYNWSIRNLSLQTLPDLYATNPNMNTRFLPYLSFAANWALGGPDVTGYHAFNFGIHAFNTFWVYCLMFLILMTPRMRGVYSPKAVYYLSSFSALIFMAHPLQTQAVTYIVQRMASMAAFFYLGAVVLYLKARSGSGALYYGGAIAMGVGAMFCKENAITLPLAIIMIDMLFSQPKDAKWKTRLQWAPFLATALISLYLSGILQKFFHFLPQGGGMVMKDVLPDSAKEGVLPCGKYFLTQLRVLCTYLRLFFFPVNQNLDYDYPVAGSLMEPPTFFCALALIGLMAVGVKFLKRNRLVSFVIGWFFLTLSVESSVIPIHDVIFEHRMYLPLAGCAVIFPMVILLMEKKLLYATAAGAILVSVFSVATYTRNRVWGSEVSLWEDVVKKSPNKARPYNNLGTLLLNEGNAGRARKMFEKATELDPRFAAAFFNLGTVYDKSGDADKAMALYNKALEISPEFSAPYNALGALYGRKGDFEQAEKNFEKTIRLEPANALGYENLGVNYVRKGSVDKAIATFEKAIKVNPDHAQAYCLMGNALLTRGDWEKAMGFYQKASALDPNYPEPVQMLGEVYLRKMELEKAEGQVLKLRNMNAPKVAQTLEDLLVRVLNASEKNPEASTVVKRSEEVPQSGGAAIPKAGT